MFWFQRTGTALLLRELAQIAIAGGTQYLKALAFKGLRKRTYTQARGVF